MVSGGDIYFHTLTEGIAASLDIKKASQWGAGVRLFYRTLYCYTCFLQTLKYSVPSMLVSLGLRVGEWEGEGTGRGVAWVFDLPIESIN